jgi:hypothetical protein
MHQQERLDMTMLVEAARRAQVAANAEYARLSKAYAESGLLDADEIDDMARFEANRVYDGVFDRLAA